VVADAVRLEETQRGEILTAGAAAVTRPVGEAGICDGSDHENL
jgi:hypothetical protein